eukprot:TRINITY_DN1779_c0_g1_i1.p1 TRINITY_DN1779_c0_g1~~TRINITY_DN1779_c0_g1_i1.p1  ORF type:complete len:1158 (-),score=248.27 TRINITY_DN1779_c0_g1_i1:108-3185(-)
MPQPQWVMPEQLRYSSHVATDKQFYKPGDMLYFRAALLHAFTLAPLPATDGISARAEFVGPSGDTVHAVTCGVQDAVAAGSWHLPEGVVGGDYQLRLSYTGGFRGLPKATPRNFTVLAFRNPRLNVAVDFLYQGYGPGDAVAFTVAVTRADATVPEGAELTAEAVVDGTQVWSATTSLPQSGTTKFSFSLPTEIASPDASVRVVVDDKGTIESKGKALPLVLRRLDVALYPEGGDLAPGLPNRVYFEARTLSGLPVEIVADLVDAASLKPVVLNILGKHEGRGSFVFTPADGAAYELIIKKPAGIERAVRLPEAPGSAPKAVLTTNEQVFGNGDPVVAQVYALKALAGQTVRVVLRKREVVLEEKTITIGKSNPHTVSFSGRNATKADGVLVLTLYDATGKPVAERLAFRRPDSGALTVRIAVELPSGAAPGAEAQVRVRCEDAVGKPAQAVVGVVVTDAAVRRMAEPRKMLPRIEPMVYLEDEVDVLEDAEIYLSDDPRAALALDLLLGTQGWRRFAYEQWNDFLAKYKDKALTLGVYAPAQQWEAGGVMHKNLIFAMAPMRLEDAPVAAMALERAPMLGIAAPAPMQGIVAPDFPRRGKLIPPPVDRCVREYAHARKPQATHGEREDFTETLFWAAALKTDADGVASSTFALSDLVTTFDVFADAFLDRASGAVASASATFVSTQPFYIEPKLPLYVTEGDTVITPVAVVNDGGEAVKVHTTATVDLLKLRLEGEAAEYLSLPAGSRGRQLISAVVTDANSSVTQMSFTSTTTSGLSDKVTLPITIAPKGFPVSVTAGGMLDTKAPVKVPIEMPQSYSALSVTTSLYPTPTASLMKALAALIREPYGCFEQTSSVTYPTVMAARYFKTHSNVDPELVERANTMLQKGYERLVSFESKDGGYEWFGESPAHEALTAYGLVEFLDMAEVFPVDRRMVDRTRAWLLGQREDDGFRRNRKQLDTFGGAPDSTTNAYIVWSLTYAGITEGLEAQITALSREALKSKDTYFVGLVAGIMFNTGPHKRHR